MAIVCQEELEALQTAMIKLAEFLGLTKTFGTVEKSKIADLVFLNANPLENITNTKCIEAVISAGRVLDQNALNRTGVILLMETADSAPPVASVSSPKDYCRNAHSGRVTAYPNSNPGHIRSLSGAKIRHREELATTRPELYLWTEFARVCVFEMGSSVPDLADLTVFGYKSLFG